MEIKESLPVLYRPKSLNEIIGNTSNVNVIKGQFETRKINKTWMMAGPPGSGKTTIAKIMAMTLNCEKLKGIDPCLKCRSCKSALNDSNPDIHEVNLAGEQGKVEGIRSILDMCKYQPQHNFRVVIADEIQGATAGTKKEILKTLENPPSHVVWILCTMHPEQLSDAIHGRCLRLFWNYPTPKIVANKLYKISKIEYSDIYKLTKPYLKSIVESCSCQPRESIQMLETISSAINSKKYTKKEEIKQLVKTTIQSIGEIDTVVISFLNYALVSKKAEPFRIMCNIEESKTLDFFNTAHNYSMYAAAFYISKKTKKTLDKSKFYGVSFIRFDNSLNKLTCDDTQCFKLCNVLGSIIKDLRMGFITPRIAITTFMDKYYE